MNVAPISTFVMADDDESSVSENDDSAVSNDDESSDDSSDDSSDEDSSNDDDEAMNEGEEENDENASDEENVPQEGEEVTAGEADDAPAIVLSIPVPDGKLKAGETQEIPVNLEKHTVDITSFEIVITSDLDTLTFEVDSGIGGYFAENSGSKKPECRVDKVGNESNLVITWEASSDEEAYTVGEKDGEFLTFFVNVRNTVAKDYHFFIKECTFNGDNSLVVEKQEGKFNISASNAEQNGSQPSGLQTPSGQNQESTNLLEIVVFIVCVLVGGFMLASSIVHMKRLFKKNSQSDFDGNTKNLNASVSEINDELEKIRLVKLDKLIDKIIQ